MLRLFLSHRKKLSKLSPQGKGLILFFLLVCLLVPACSVSRGGNHPPQIERVVAVPQILSTSDETCTLTAYARDEDGDTLRYIWDVSAGQVSNPSATAIWLLRGVGPGTYRATCLVSDGKAISSQSVTITVRRGF